MKHWLKKNRYLLSIVRWYFRCVLKRTPNVFMYHRFSKEKKERFISIDEFDKQINYLVSSGYEMLTFFEYCRRVKHGERVDKKTAILTFDDGYNDFYNYAFPILQKYGVKGTLFITTGFISGREWMYQDKIKYIFEHSLVEPGSITLPSGKKITTGHKFDLNFAWNIIAEELLQSSEVERSSYIDYLQDLFGVGLPSFTPDQYQALTWTQVKDLSDKGIEIGSHCVNHLSLANQPKEVVDAELVLSKHSIENNLDKKCFSFCYPFGMKTDVDKNIAGMVKSAGYKYACIAYPNRAEFDLFQVGRSGVNSDFRDFLNKLSGLD